MNAEDHVDDFQRLYGLVTESEDIKDYLDAMTGVGASMMTRLTGERIECAVTLRRRKRRTTIAGSSDDAILLDRVEQRLGKGPCALALETGSPVLLDDVFSDERWPRFSENLAAMGCRSVLGVPMPSGFDAEAVLDFFAPSAGTFTDEVIQDAGVFADMAGRALSSVLRIATAEEGPGTSGPPSKPGRPSTSRAACSWLRTRAGRKKRSESFAGCPVCATKNCMTWPRKSSPKYPADTP